MCVKTIPHSSNWVLIKIKILSDDVSSNFYVFLCLLALDTENSCCNTLQRRFCVTYLTLLQGARITDVSHRVNHLIDQESSTSLVTEEFREWIFLLHIEDVCYLSSQRSLISLHDKCSCDVISFPNFTLIQYFIIDVPMKMTPISTHAVSSWCSLGVGGLRVAIRAGSKHV